MPLWLLATEQKGSFMPRHALLPRHAMPDYRHFPNRALRRGLAGSFTAMRWLALLVFAGMLSTILVSMPARAEVLKQPGYWINPTSDGQLYRAYCVGITCC